MIKIHVIGLFYILFSTLACPTQRCGVSGKRHHAVARFRELLAARHIRGTVTALGEHLQIDLNPGFINFAPVDLLSGQGVQGIRTMHQASFSFVTFCGKDEPQSALRCQRFTIREAEEVVGLAATAAHKCASRTALSACIPWLELSTPSMVNPVNAARNPQ